MCLESPLLGHFSDSSAVRVAHNRQLWANGMVRQSPRADSGPLWANTVVRAIANGPFAHSRIAIARMAHSGRTLATVGHPNDPVRAIAVMGEWANGRIFWNRNRRGSRSKIFCIVRRWTGGENFFIFSLRRIRCYEPDPPCTAPSPLTNF